MTLVSEFLRRKIQWKLIYPAGSFLILGLKSRVVYKVLHMHGAKYTPLGNPNFPLKVLLLRVITTNLPLNVVIDKGVVTYYSINGH